MKRANTVADALNTGSVLLDFGGNLPKVPIPLDGDFGGEPGPPGAGVPSGGSALQVVRKNAANTTTEWADVNKSLIGLHNVDNTSDVNKPVSNATQIALGGKADKTELNNKADLVGGKIPVAQLPATGIVTDSSVAAQVNSPETGAEIDGRITTQATPLVQPIVADYIASSQVVVDAAAAAVNANPKIVEIVNGAQVTTGAHLDTITAPGKKFQPSNANAKLDLGYPVERAGVLNVDQWGYSDGPLLMEQYWPYNYEGMFFRPIYYTSKTWKEIPTKVAVQSMIDASGIQPATSSRTSVVAIGDSLTAGYSNGAAWGSAEKWPTILDTLLPGATVTNEGFTGHLVDGTMITIGALKPRFTIPGGTIPASGTSVAVTTNQVYGIPQGISAGGTLAGVLGVLDHTNGGGFTFRSLNGASATGITGIHEFKANRQGTWETKTAIIWLGRNDISNATTGMEATVPDHIVASTKRLVEQLTPRVKQIMICGVTTRTTEESGSPQHAWVTETNDRLRDLFPEYFKSAQDYWRDEALADLGITPTATDTAKIAAGTIPPSIMDDETHPSKALANAMARHFFHPFLTGKGYVD